MIDWFDVFMVGVYAAGVAAFITLGLLFLWVTK